MKVTKEVYLEYLRNYPNKLYTIETEVCEPQMLSHIDTITKETVATVAKEWMDNKGNVAVVGSDQYYEYFVKSKNGA